MSTFTAVVLDRLLESGASNSMAAGKNVSNSNLERRKSTPKSKLERGVSVPNSKLQSSSSTSMLLPIDRKHHWPMISPALYATPESTPLPDSPSSFPPSPYIINHKRRGPRLVKSFSEDDVASRQQALDEEKAAENAKNAEREVVDSDKDVIFMFPVPIPIEKEHVNGIYDGEIASTELGNGLTKQNGSPKSIDGELGSTELSNGLAKQNGSLKSVTYSLERDGEVEDFFEPQDSISVKSSTEGESNSGVERSLNVTSMAEFYDAWEELSPEIVLQPPVHDIEAELREIKSSLLMEIEKQKQAEEALNNMRSQWLRIRQQLSLVGLKLPSDPIAVVEDERLDDPAEELCQQVYFARFVSNSIGRGTAKAEVEVEMEAQLEMKNFEIARLWDRLHYYEAVNREMSQRNQEVVETARRLKQSRKRRQRWVWGSIAAAVMLGTTALAWSYIPTGKGSSSTNQSHAPEGNHSSK